MDSKLRTLEGIIAVVRVLGEADDAICPGCLSLLANCGADPVIALSGSWRDGKEVLALM